MRKDVKRYKRKGRFLREGEATNVVIINGLLMPCAWISSLHANPHFLWFPLFLVLIATSISTFEWYLICHLLYLLLSFDLRNNFLPCPPLLLLFLKRPTSDRFSSNTITENRGYLRDTERHWWEERRWFEWLQATRRPWPSDMIENA